MAFHLVLRLGYPVYNSFRISEVRWERSDGRESELAYLLGPLRGGSAFREIALAYFYACPESSRRMRRIPSLKRTKMATLSHDRYRASTKTINIRLLILLSCWLDYKQKEKDLKPGRLH